jgi:succinate dehydrogenase hydrophobic anchor subunit
MEKTNRKRSKGTWIWQAFSGLLLIALLTLHMVAHHFVVEGGLRDFDDVLAYIRNPLIIILEMTFLVVVTYHALVGLRAILSDLGLKASTRKNVNVLLTVLGVVMVGWGFYLTWYLATQA